MLLLEVMDFLSESSFFQDGSIQQNISLVFHHSLYRLEKLKGEEYHSFNIFSYNQPIIFYIDPVPGAN